VLEDLCVSLLGLADIEQRMAAALDDHGTRLRDVDGVGTVTAVRLIGQTGHASRFPTAHAFATYAGVAPIEVASGDRARHRLSRSGERRLNSAVHLIALTQVRMPTSIGRRYFDTKIDDGKSRNEAMRCLKRRLANHLWRLMIADEQRLSATPENHDIAAGRDAEETRVSCMSASAWSSLSQREPTEFTTPVSARRSVTRNARYCTPRSLWCTSRLRSPPAR
jgi:hypothetical protein